MEQYTGFEMLAIANAKHEIRLAKQKMAEINKERDERERVKARAAEEARLMERRSRDAAVMQENERRLQQLAIDKENFDDRVRLFLSKVSRELKTLDLKLIGDWKLPHFSTYNIGSRIEVKDNKSDTRTTVKVVEGKGFEWS